MTRDVTAQNFRDTKICKFKVGHILHIQLEGYQEPHNKVGSRSPFLPSPLERFELRTFQFCVLHAILLCQTPRMKNKKNTKNNIG